MRGFLLTHQVLDGEDEDLLVVDADPVRIASLQTEDRRVGRLRTRYQLLENLKKTHEFG